MLKKVEGFIRDEKGLSTIEYIIGAGVMAGLALLVFTSINDKIGGASNQVGNAIQSAGDAAANR